MIAWFFVCGLIAILIMGDGDMFQNVISNILLVAFMLFMTSAGIRRFHDIGITGLCMFLAAIPYVSLVVLLYLCFKKGNAEANKFGEPEGKRSFMNSFFNK
jgi:uncharacterized membrane protein YhaH (DUF805 family)